MSYPPPPVRRRSSAAERYTPDAYAHPGAPLVQAPQSGGRLAPGVPIAMPQPNVAYHAPPPGSPLVFGSTPPGAPPPMPHAPSYPRRHSPQRARSGTMPPYPVQDPATVSSPRAMEPRRYSHSSQQSRRSGSSRRPSYNGQYRTDHGGTQNRVHFDDDKDNALAYDSEDDSDDYEDRRRHHSSYTPSSERHHHHHHKTGSKSKYDDHRPTLGDTVMSMVNGLKDYVTK